MRPSIRSFPYLFILTAVIPGWASPLSSKLLPLVPSGSPIVAGFENRYDTNAHGRLLLTTHNNRLDLDDWQALTGVDNKRIFEEVIEVAGSPGGENLSEHLLLVSGHFDRNRIFTAAEQNGAEKIEYQGQSAMVIKPFLRERGDMLDTRWLVILENRIGLLGTPLLVQQALTRYANHSVPDPILEERLSLLRPDVSSWNVIVSTPTSAKNINFAQPRSAWARLQEGADVLMVGTRFGPKVRVDFSIHAGGNRGAAFFSEKAGFFTSAFAAETVPQASPSEAQRRLENLSIEPNRVHGSILLSETQFELWVAQIGRIQFLGISEEADTAPLSKV